MKNECISAPAYDFNRRNHDLIHACVEDWMNDPFIPIAPGNEALFQTVHPNLFAHLSRVKFYVQLFCIKLSASGYQEMSVKDCLDLGKAAFFHDIGKIRIPQDILMRSDKLTVQETAIIRQHPVDAQEILMMFKFSPFFSNSPQLFDLAVAASLFHHEWWDGAGYPFGISGEDIPVIARITSICDAFDTITYGRPYCKARSSDDAFCEIRTYAGSQFDPVLSNLFIEYRDIFLMYVQRCLQAKPGDEGD